MIKKPWCIMAFIFIAIPLFSQQVVELEEVMRFTDDPDNEVFMKRPKGIKLDDNGNIYIQDKPHILKFGPDGKFLAKLIEIGQGPGELTDDFIGGLRNFTIIGNKVIAFSDYPYKIMWLNEKGKFQEEKKFPTRGDPQFFVTLDLNYYLFENKMPRPDEMPNAGSFKYSIRLCRISPDFKEKEVIHTFPMEGEVSRQNGPSSPREAQYALIDSETIVVNVAEEYEFFTLNLRSGEKLKTYSHKYKRVKLSVGRKRYFPAIQSMHYVSPDLWVITRTRDKDNSPLVCSHDLETGSVEEFFLRFPKSDSSRRNFSYNLTIANGFIFTIEQSPEGFYNIVKYQIKNNLQERR